MAKIIRTPTRVAGGLTADERRAMDEHAKIWIARAMRTTPVDVDEITSAIHDLYAVANLDRPIVVVVPSPLVMAFAYGASAAIWHDRGATYTATDTATESAIYTATDTATTSATRNASYTATRSAIYTATDTATGNAIYNATASATGSATGSATDTATESATYSAAATATGNAIYNAIYNATRSATASAIESATRSATRSATDTATVSATLCGAVTACRDLAGEFGIESATRWYENYQGGAYWAGYDAYLTAFRDILGLRLPEHAKYSAWERAAIAAPFRIMHHKFCIMSDFPDTLKVDDQNRPHCATGPSHRWRDGWSLYHWHGVRIPAEWIEVKGALTAQIALSQTNVELRRAACEMLGWHKILDNLNARIIDDDGDPQIGVLIEVDLPDSGKERFLKVECGTGRTFALPVPREVKTALEAQSVTWGLDAEEFVKPEVRT